MSTQIEIADNLELSKTVAINSLASRRWTILESDTAKELLAGAVGGMAGLAIGHPFDTVKVLMHNATAQPSVINITKAVNQAGVFTFFRGLSLPFYSYGVVNAVTFASYKSMLRYLDPTECSPLASAMAGAFAGAIQLIPNVPVELVKIQQQKDVIMEDSFGRRHVATCIREIIQQRGFRGLYTGTVIQAFRDVPGLMTYFFIYAELIKLAGDERVNQLWPAFCAGAVSGAASWVVSLPFDVVKSRLQAGTEVSMKAVLAQLLREENCAVFFRGFSVVMTRALLVNASIFAVYEQAYAHLKNQH